MAHIMSGMVQNSTNGHINGNGLIEKRRVHRRRILKSGSIIINSGYSKFDCTVRNLNENGALLKMSDVTELPSRFELEIDGDGIARAVEVVWKHDTQIGVSFPC